MRTYTDIFVPYSFQTVVKGSGGMGRLLANSTSIAQIIVIDDDGTRVDDAVVTISVVRPDTEEKTIDALDVPLLSNGVYRVTLPTTAFPLPIRSYEIDWVVTVDTDEYNPTDYVNVWSR